MNEELHGRAWTRWGHEKPPTGVWVLGLYSFAEKPVRGMICMRGCCFNTENGDGLIPPMWWS